MIDPETLKVYAAINWPIFPCLSKDAIVNGKTKGAKAPLTPHGFKDATYDLGQVAKWHQQYPDCAWATATSSMRGVMDIDPRNGGVESLAKMIALHGPLPKTPRGRTGGDGWHYFFQFPVGTGCSKPYPGIDVKAEGGYVIVPPSKIDIPEHEGRAYAWEERPWILSIAKAPAWLVESKDKGKEFITTPGSPVLPDDPWIVQASGDDLAVHPGAPEGQRRVTLCRLVGVHLARGDSSSTVNALAEAWAARCRPVFTDWAKHVQGLIRRERKTMTTPLILSPLSPLLAPCSTDGKEGRKKVGATVSDLADTSFLPSGEDEGGEGREEEGEDGCHLAYQWPTLSPDAYHGLFGSMLRALTPETEADPSGILLGWLTCFGSIVGRGAWQQVGATRHHPALFSAVVGATSDAKGDSWAASLWPFKELDPAWAGQCIAYGIGSGEGLVERIADDQTVMDRDSTARLVEGAKDKRCLVRLSELSRCFTVGRRKESTLSEYLRESWDGSTIHIPNRKNNALTTTDYSVSVVGDITPGVIRKLIEGGTESVDGFANRFLWACVRSSRDLPDGGNISVLKPFLKPLADALASAKGAGEMGRDEGADVLWKEVYGVLKRSGDTVPHTDRARPYVVRLAMLYALADKSTTITVDHLLAGLAVWDYCRQSAALIFGNGGGQEGVKGQDDPLWLKILNAITTNPGISRSDLLRAFRSVQASEMDRLLQGLEDQGHAHKVLVSTGGRSAGCWYLGRKEGGNDDNPLVPLFPHPTPFTHGQEGRKEESPCPTSTPSPSPVEGRKEGKKPLGPETEILPSFLPSTQTSAYLPASPEKEIPPSFLPSTDADKVKDEGKGVRGEEGCQPLPSDAWLQELSDAEWGDYLERELKEGLREDMERD